MVFTCALLCRPWCGSHSEARMLCAGVSKIGTSTPVCICSWLRAVLMSCTRTPAIPRLSAAFTPSSSASSHTAWEHHSKGVRSCPYTECTQQNVHTNAEDRLININTHTHRHTHTELTDWLCLMMYKLVMAQTYMLIQIHTRF